MRASLGRGTLLCSLLLLAACAGRVDRGSLIPAESRGGSDLGHYKVGNPYQIKGQWYYPKEDYSYDETGIASWYGADFHAQRTANGEIYNKDELTAAHKTLPLPSLARVTNLETGKSIVVRVNDRGPFSGARVIDVSQRTAQLLGFERQGTARVRVQVLADESKAIADAMRRYGTDTPGGQSAAPVMTASAQDTSVTEVALPETRAEAKAMMASIKPIQVTRQLEPVTSSRLYVQAGSFSQRENAVRLRDQLAASFGNAVVSEAKVNGTVFYRVRVGPLPDVPSADKTLKLVRNSGIGAARTVVDIPSS